MMGLEVHLVVLTVAQGRVSYLLTNQQQLMCPIPKSPPF